MIRQSYVKLSVSAFAAISNRSVRPHLEYAMQACSPNLVTDTDCLEQLQWLATRLVKASVDCHMRNDHVGWVCTPYAGVASVETLYNFFFRRIGYGLQPFFIPSMWQVLRGHPFKVLQSSFGNFKENRPFQL